jgi:hypothetical protein
MRTLALAIAAALCLGVPAAEAVCTTGVECIRERFGPDLTIRNNRIIDRTDRLGDRGRPENPYLAGQNVAAQARRAGRFDSTMGRAGRGVAADRYAEPLTPGEVRPDVRYTPEAALDPYTPGTLAPGPAPSGFEDGPELTVDRYNPALPATGEPGATAAGEQALPRSRTARASAPTERDRNTPRGAADLRYGGPRSSGAYR